MYSKLGCPGLYLNDFTNFFSPFFRPAFRWDGTPLVDKSKESQFLKKVKSMDTETCNLENSPPPKPPIRDSSRKREEIK